MKRDNKIISISVLAIIVLFGIFTMNGCTPPRGATTAENEATAPSVEKKAVTEANKPAASHELTAEELYAKAPPELTPVQCAQCHRPIYEKLRKAGGKHRIFCTRCHDKFHTYNPVQNNWREIMPKCKKCHTTPPHGEKHKDCLNCHKEPHTPRVVPLTEYLTKSCGDCHGSELAQLKKFPSAHTKQGCTACHDKHGFIPSCLNCHDPHVEGQTFEACKACHPAHKPLQVQFVQKYATADVCNACHDEEYEKWSHTKSKHGKVQCVQCHDKHGFIPNCSKCHGTPHPPEFVKHFKGCLECHIDVHDLPTKQGTKQ